MSGESREVLETKIHRAPALVRLQQAFHLLGPLSGLHSWEESPERLNQTMEAQIVKSHSLQIRVQSPRAEIQVCVT